jgi:L-lactate dehydrogenase (cytochrome)
MNEVSPLLSSYHDSSLRLSRLNVSYNSILFRPRTLINVEECNTSCKMLGEDTSLPIFISPAGMAGLAHPLAEKGLAKAAGVCGIIQMVRCRAEAR